MNESSSPRFNPLVVTGLVGGLTFICGLVIGLPVLGWWLWPVQWTDIPQTPLATYTPLPTYTPYPTYTPFPTATPTSVPPSPTPGPDAIVLVPTNILEGPGLEFAIIGQVSQAEELRVIGQYDNCQWLKVVTHSELTGWVTRDSSAISILMACDSLPSGTFRPLTGNLKTPVILGNGELSIENGSQVDGVVAIADSIKPGIAIAAAFIRFGEKLRIVGIPDGVYIVLFATGSGWLDKDQLFENGLQVKQFEGTFDFTTTAQHYTTWEISLQPVLGGEGRTDVVSPDKFPLINP